MFSPGVSSLPIILCYRCGAGQTSGIEETTRLYLSSCSVAEGEVLLGAGADADRGRRRAAAPAVARMESVELVAPRPAA